MISLRIKNCWKEQVSRLQKASQKIVWQKLNKVRETYGFMNVWTNEGKIFFKDERNPSSKPLVYYD